MHPTPLRVSSVDIPVYAYTNEDGASLEFSLDLELRDDGSIKVERATLSQAQAETVAAFLDNVGSPTEYGEKAVSLSIEVAADDNVSNFSFTVTANGGIEVRQIVVGSVPETIRIPGGDPADAAIAFIKAPDAFKDALQS